MVDYQKIAEMTFLVMELNQVLVFDNGIVIDRDNFAEFISYWYDA